MHKKIVSIALLLLVMLSCLNCFYADENIDKNKNLLISSQSRMESIKDYDCHLDLNSSGKASIYAVVEGNDVDSLKIIARLQKNNGHGWKTIKTYNRKIYSSELELMKYYHVSEGTYRLKLTFIASKNGKNEYVTAVSSEKEY